MRQGGRRSMLSMGKRWLRERERVRDVLPDGWPKGGGGHAPLDRDPLVRGKRKGG
jgi:hypothetical protein